MKFLLKLTGIPFRGRHVGRWLLLPALAALAILGFPTVARGQLTIQSITPTAITNTPGTTASYNINYTWPNLTQTATGAVLSITVPSPAQNTSANNVVLVGNSQITNAFFNTTNQTIYFQFVSPLAAGSAGTVQFQASLRNDGTVTNGAAANFGVTFSAQGQTSVFTNATLTASGVLDNATVSKSILGKGIITTNAQFTYQLSPRNSTPSLNITNWTMVDTLPPNVIYVSSSPPGTATTNGNVVSLSWTTNSFLVGKSPNYFVTVYAPSSSFNTNYVLTNRVVTTNIFIDGNTVVARTTNTTTLTSPTVSFDLISKSALNWSGQFNSPFTWSVGWRSRGNDTANTLTVTDPLPAAFNLTAINPGFADINPTTVYVRYQTNNNSTWLNLPGSPFTTTNGADANNKTFYTTNLHLSGAAFVSSVQWIYTNVGPLMTFNSGDTKPTLTGSITNIDHTGAIVPTTASITNFATLSASYYGTNIALGTTSNYVTLAVAAPLVSLSKSTSSGNPAQPGQTNTWSLKLSNGSTASDNLTNPVTADLLPLSLQYVPGSASGVGGNLTNVTVTVTTNFHGTGRTLLKFQYAGYLKPTATATTTIKTYLSGGVAPGTVANSYSLIAWANTTINSSSPLVADTNNLTGNTNTMIPTVSGNLTVTAAAVASSQKTIKGELDSAYQAYPLYGSSYPGGPFTYRETVSNPGNVTLTNITVVDILPFVGDVGVQVTNQARGSAWQPFLTGPVSGPSGVTVYYSTSSNPYRPEILGAATPGSPGDWSTTLPADLSTVRALKFAFGPTNVLNPLDSVQLTWAMQVPIAASTNTFAYNTFAYTATPAISSTSPLISEPNKVGILANPLQPAYLGDYVWNDANGDGLQNDGNTGLNGVRVELYLAGPSGKPNSPDDTLLQFVLTATGPNGNPGYYQFPYLTNGNYFVRVVAPPNYAFSPANQGSNPNLNSKFDATTGWSSFLTLSAGQTNETVDCGLVPTTTGSLGDYVWLDRNGDGLQNEGSIDGLNGVTVNLYKITGTTNLYQTTTTAFDTFGNPGYYHFYNLPVGTYQLQFVPPAGDTFTTREANGANSGSGSEANSAGLTAVFTVTAGSVNNTWDAGIILPTGPYSIGNVVWYDPNADGRYDFFGGERGVDNVVVDLYYDTDNSGTFTPGTDQLFSSTLTSTIGGEPGNYSFNNLPSTNYVVVVDAINFQPGGALFGLTNDPSSTAVAPGYVDNLNKGNQVGSYLASTGFKLTASTTAVDFGLTSQTNLFSVGDTVFYDTNGNGKQDAGETGVSGINVQLYQTGLSGIVGGSDATLVTSTNTDASGFYSFANLPPTNYFIQIPTPPASAPAPSPVVYTGNVTNGLNHGVQPGGFATAVYGPSFYLTNNDVTADFGFYNTTGLVAVGNTVFQDLNANGVQDTGEPGISGVGLALAKIVAGLTNVVAYTTSDTNGHYLFDLLPPANYQVVVLATNFGPAGPLTNLLSSPGANTSSPTNNYSINDHGVDVTSPAVNGIRAAVYNLLVGAAPAPATNATPAEVPSTNAHVYVDFGFAPTFSLGNRVFADNGAGGGVMNNGIQDGAEPGLSNVVVKVFNADINGNPTGSALASSVTDALGYYRIDGLLAGTYVVVVDEFGSGTALGGLASSTGWDTSLTTADDQNDHGIDIALGAGAVVPGGIASLPVMVGVGLQPLAEPDVDVTSPNSARGYAWSGDANDNLVVDFGFAPAYSIAKTIVAVTQPPATAGGAVITPAGQASYGLVVGLPAGSLAGLTVSDLVPAGMQYVSSQVITTAAGSSNLLAGNFNGALPNPVVSGGSGDGAAVSWNFGAISVPGIVRTNTQYFVILVTLQALDVPGNVGLGANSLLVNNATVTVPGQPVLSATPVSLTVVEPAVSLLKSMTPPATDPQGVVTVTLVATNYGTSAAYSVNLQDILSSTNFDLTSVNFGASGVAYPASFLASYTAATGALLYSGGTIPAGAAATFTFTVKLAATATPGATITNLATVTQVTTLPGGGGRREPGSSAFNTINVYNHSVSGYVYADANNNGGKDPGEAGFGGVTVTLTGTTALSQTVNLSTNTAADGSYFFGNLAPGAYTITRASTPAGYLDGKETAGSTFGGTVNNTSASVTISGLSIPAGGNATGTDYNFGLVQPNSLAGLVFSDQNNDGILNGSDYGISNVVVKLTGTSDWGAVNTTASTLADGAYSFGNLRPGTYTLTETQPAAYGQGRTIVGSTGGVNSAPDVVSAITLTQNQTGAGYNFAEIPGAVSGNVFQDHNYNLALDSGEGLAGLPVTLTGTNLLGQNISLTTATTASGAFSFSSLLAGHYTVSVPTNSLPAGLVQDVDPDSVLDSATSFNLPAGQTVAGLNYGYYQPVTIGDYVWNDLNGDGLQNDGATGLTNVGLTLTGTNLAGVTITNHVVTDTAGHYSFTGPPGAYAVSVDATNFLAGGTLAGFSPTFAGRGAVGAGSKLSPAGTSLTEGQSDATLDFGYYQPVAIGDFVWVDSNRNGVQDPGEPGLAGVSVVLYRTNSGLGALTAVATNVSAANGSYAFTNQSPGDFVVGFSLPGGFGYTRPTAGGDATRDSDARSNGQTVVFTLASGQSNTTIDAGFVPLVALGNLVFDDNNGNGVFDAGDIGSPNVTVQLYTNGQVAEVSVPLASVDTDANGHYYFDSLAPGAYFVHIPAHEFQAGGHLSGHLPEFATYSGDNQNHGIYDSHPELRGLSSALVVLAIGTQPTGEDATGYPGSVADTNSNFTIDFGTVPPAGAVSIGDTVFLDLNNNGHQDAGELGINGVTVELWKVGAGPGGTDVLDETQVTANLGGNDGAYLFTEPPGAYYVKIPAGNFAPGGALAGLPLVSSTVLAGNGNNKGVQAGGNGTAAVGAAFTLTTNQDNFFQDFGFTAPVTIGDFVWEDANGNGVQDAGELGLAGVSVVLYRTNSGLGTLTALATNVSSVTGAYAFTNVPPGDFVAGFALPNGYRYTSATAGGNTNLDSNVLPVLGQTPVFTLTSGRTNNSIDAGYYRPVQITGGVKLDVNGNGVGDPADTNGVSPVVINLYNSLSNLVATVTNGADGGFSFTNLPPGNYTVVQVVPAGYVATTPPSLPVTVNSGGTGNANYLDFLPATVTGHLYVDTNGNGAQDAGEPNLINVTVNVTNSTNGIQTLTTDGNGNWAAIVPPGLTTDSINKTNAAFTSQAGVSPVQTQGANPSTVTAVAGVTTANLADGFFNPAMVQGRLYLDANGNGLQDPGELNLTNVMITVTDSTNGVQTVTTDTNGNWSAIVPPGATIDSIATNSPAFTGQAGTNAVQSQGANPATTTAVAGTTAVAVPDGFFQPASIVGSVKLDLNGNGLAEPGDTNAITPVEIDVYAGSTNLVATVANLPDGSFSVTNLPPGNYTVVQVVPPGYRASTPPVLPVILVSGQTNTVNYLDAIIAPCVIGDYVWNDVNGDGVQNVNEPPLPNVRVFADLNQDGIWEANEPMALTDIHGHYYLSNLVFGTYVVRVDTNTLPAFASATFDLDGLATPNAATVTLTPGQVLLTADFGYRYSNPTLALLKSMTATVVNGEAVIEWQTASEVDTLAFDLYRQSAAGEWLLVTAEPVLALNSISGGAYSVVDTTARIPGTYTYKLVEWRLDGTEHVAGMATLRLLPPVRVTSVVRLGNAMKVAWEGGVAPYRLEQSAKLDGAWTEVPLADPAATSVLLPLDGTVGFFRITNAQ